MKKLLLVLTLVTISLPAIASPSGAYTSVASDGDTLGGGGKGG